MTDIDLTALLCTLLDRIALLEERLDAIVDLLEFDEPGYYREIVDLPDLSTYQPEEAR